MGHSYGGIPPCVSLRAARRAKSERDDATYRAGVIRAKRILAAAADKRRVLDGYLLGLLGEME